MRKNRAMQTLFPALLTSLLVSSAGASFTFVAKTDAITDANRSFIYADGLENEDATLYFQCMEDGLNVYVDPDEYLGDEPYGLYRFDKLAATPEFDWDSSTKGTVAYLPLSRLKTFISAARKARVLTVRLYDYDDAPTTMSFDLTGLAASLQKLPCAKGF